MRVPDTTLDLSKSHLYKLTANDRVPHSKPNGKKLYFHREDLDAPYSSSRIVFMLFISELRIGNVGLTAAGSYGNGRPETPQPIIPCRTRGSQTLFLSPFSENVNAE